MQPLACGGGCVAGFLTWASTHRTRGEAERLATWPQGSEFDFVPSFYILPREYDEFRHDVERHPAAMYIQKPLASSRGRGIKMVVKPREMPRDAACLVQRYIRNPLLIDGYKFDIRLYCVVTCFDPLKVGSTVEGGERGRGAAHSGTAPTGCGDTCTHGTVYMCEVGCLRHGDTRGQTGACIPD